MKRWQDIQKINNRFYRGLRNLTMEKSWSNQHYNWLSEIVEECEMLKQLDEAVGKFIGV